VALVPMEPLAVPPRSTEWAWNQSQGSSAPGKERYEVFISCSVPPAWSEGYGHVKNPRRVVGCYLPELRQGVEASTGSYNLLRHSSFWGGKGAPRKLFC
jgi:hypothetical protein